MLEHMLETFSYLPLSNHELKKWMSLFLDEQLKGCDDVAFSAQFPFKQTGLPQRFFQQKIITFAGSDFLTGPRYLGGDVNQPFIDLVASSSPLTRQAAREIFKVWQPLGAQTLRVLRRPGLVSGGTVDQLFYGGTLLTPKPNPSLEISRADMSHFDWCLQAIEQAYAETYLRMPQLRGQVFPTDHQELEVSIRQGEVFMLSVDQERAGLIICHVGNRAFIHGNWITDEIVVPKFRGRQLASEVQRQLFAFLPGSHDTPLLWGNIFSGNVPSMRTAQRAGRGPLMEYAFLREEDIQS